MIYEGVVKNNFDSWALQWGYHRHKNHGMTCIPSRSLIKNIGFGEDATHTKLKIFADKVVSWLNTVIKEYQSQIYFK